MKKKVQVTSNIYKNRLTDDLHGLVDSRTDLEMLTYEKIKKIFQQVKTPDTTQKN